MKAALAITVLLLSPVITPAALAQDTAGQAGAVGEPQKPAGSREPSNSFEALPLVLQVGQEVKVRVNLSSPGVGELMTNQADSPHVLIATMEVQLLWPRS